MYMNITGTLQTLFEINNKVSSLDIQSRFFITRLSRKVNALRNEFRIEINMHGVYYDPKNKRKTYEKYRLKRSKENLQKVQNILKTHSTKKPLKKAHR